MAIANPARDAMRTAGLRDGREFRTQATDGQISRITQLRKGVFAVDYRREMFFSHEHEVSPGMRLYGVLHPKWTAEDDSEHEFWQSFSDADPDDADYIIGFVDGLCTGAAATPAFEGIPSFFRACCREARSGGSISYARAGRELARHVEDLIPYDADSDEWAAEVDHLEALIADRRDEHVWNWFQRRYPRCMQLVPKRRRQAFLAGVYDLHS